MFGNILAVCDDLQLAEAGVRLGMLWGEAVCRTKVLRRKSFVKDAAHTPTLSAALAAPQI
jgi:hypothetical protein